MQHHFRNFTSHDGSKNAANPDAWKFWMVDKHKLSLLHVEIKLHTTTLCVPKFEDVDKFFIKETLEDINVLIKCSLNDKFHAE